MSELGQEYGDVSGDDDPTINVEDEMHGERTARHRQMVDGEWEQWIALMSALNINKEPGNIVGANVIGKYFMTLEDASTFFNLFGKLTGFSVRKGTKRFRPNGEVKGCLWLCSKEGFRHQRYFDLVDRKRESKAITRTGCKVRFRVLQNRQTGRWLVRDFHSEHNHQVAADGESMFLRSHRRVPEGTFETAKSMHEAGMKICHIVAYLIDQHGGLQNTNFLAKDLRNKLGAVDSEMVYADASRAIGYLQHKADIDVGLFAKYSIDRNRRLMNMFWSDSASQEDYTTFGHVLSFDTTYRTNKYKKPLLIFVGVNNHFRSTVFGYAMLLDETFTTYSWVLNTFLECMKGRKPKAVITDGDLAMRRAIAEVFPEAVHRLCSWHIEKNAVSNVKDPIFFSRLQRLLFKQYGEEVFENMWTDMVNELGLEGNSWVKWLYARRRSWAQTFLGGNFFAGMTTTQRNEGINAVLKKGGPHNAAPPMGASFGYGTLNVEAHTNER